MIIYNILVSLELGDTFAHTHCFAVLHLKPLYMEFLCDYSIFQISLVFVFVHRKMKHLLSKLVQSTVLYVLLSVNLRCLYLCDHRVAAQSGIF